jgi:hypothetical protein
MFQFGMSIYFCRMRFCHARVTHLMGDSKLTSSKKVGDAPSPIGWERGGVRVLR